MGTPADPADTYESGQRIKALATKTVTTTPDGAKRSVTSFAGWFDSTRNEPCSPTLAADGKTRCLPAAAAVQNPASLFADSLCSIPVTLSIGCTPPPKYIAVQASTSCPQTLGPKMFAVGQVVSTYYSLGGTTCNGPNTLTGYMFYPTSGVEIAPSSFVEMTVTTTTN